jgi:malonate-semialdehyde dehydrogenase (acetylating)/methylmalonate-semialdehyde dehydrogenase
VTGLVDAAFGCAGQRCMAGSTAVTIGKAADKLLPPLTEAVRAIKVGATDRDPTAKMGAVISGASTATRCSALIESGVKEGAKIMVVDGRGVKVPDQPKGFYLGASIVDHVRTTAWPSPRRRSSGRC